MCRLGGKLLTYKTAYFLLEYYRTDSSKIAERLSGVAAKQGTVLRNKAPLESKNALLDVLGLTETHLANTVFDATIANKKRYFMSKDGEITSVKEPDHDVRLKAAEMGGKWRGMNAPERLEVNSLSVMSTENVIDLIRNEDREVIPGKHIPPSIENGEKEKEKENKVSEDQ